jgi:hypothetical protein
MDTYNLSKACRHQHSSIKAISATASYVHVADADNGDLLIDHKVDINHVRDRCS